MEKSLKSDSEALLLKAADDAENAHRYAIEARGIMEEHKKKLSEIKTLEETIQSMRTRAKELQ